jgi:tight adherence protein B
MTLAVAFLSGLCAFGAAFFALTPTKRAWVRSRLAPHVALDEERERPSLRLGHVVARVLDGTEERYRRAGLWVRLEALRDRAGVQQRTVQLVYLAVVASVALVVLLGIAGLPWPLLPFVPVLVAAALLAILTTKAQRRLQAFDDQLPDVLDALAAALKSGHGLMQGFQTVADDAEDPAGGELDRALGEARLGRPFEAALEDMAERMRSEDFRFVLVSITIQRQVGGSLATLLETVAETVRRRQQFSRKLRALTAMGRLSARILIALPFAVALLLSLVNASYMRPLVVTHTGQVLIVVSLTMIGVGSLFLRRIVSLRS